MSENPQREPHSETAHSTPAVSAAKTKAGQNNLGIPIAIVIAAALISGAIYFSGTGNAPGGTAKTGTPSEQVTPDYEAVPALSEDDHVRGNPNAKIVMVEYSDYDCPFCSKFHATMNTLLTNDYAASGDVSWVYRHLPLQQLHPNAPIIAHMAECVAEAGGNDAFWSFSDAYFGKGGIESEEELYTIATGAGADRAALEACMTEERHIERVENDIAEAAVAGGRGTPFTVFIFSEEVSPELETLLTALKTTFVDRSGRSLFTKLSDNQVSMSGAMDTDVVDQVIRAQLGLSAE